jgi:hypothetical protein
MAKLFVLDKFIKEGTTYQTPVRVGYVVKVLGTNSSGPGKLVIEETEMGEIDSDVAPLYMNQNNILGPLDLGDYYYVIPPETTFRWEGDAGSLARLQGDIVMTEPGEGFPAELMQRFKDQARKKIRLFQGSFSLGTDEVWKANEEHEIFAITPLTTEKILFDGFIGVKITGGSWAEGEFAVRFYIDNKPLELNTAENLYLGVDAKVMPLPPTSADNMLWFSLKNYPIELLGDHSLSIRVVNVSGTDKAPTTGSAWTVTVKVLGKYERT